MIHNTIFFLDFDIMYNLFYILFMLHIVIKIVESKGNIRRSNCNSKTSVKYYAQLQNAYERQGSSDDPLDRLP